MFSEETADDPVLSAVFIVEELARRGREVRKSGRSMGELADLVRTAFELSVRPAVVAEILGVSEGYAYQLGTRLTTRTRGPSAVPAKTFPDPASLWLKTALRTAATAAARERGSLALRDVVGPLVAALRGGVTKSEAATILGCSEATVARYARPWR